MNSMEHPQHSLPSSASDLLHTIPKKQPPAHKRHTKPCKYFQVDRCPFAADVCNFAHVLLPASKDGQSAAICRHYASGKCQNGPQCHYIHLEHGEIPPAYKPDALRVTIPDSQPGWHGLSSPPDKGYPEQLPLYGPGYSSPYYTQPPHHEWTYAGGINAQSPIYLPIYASPGAAPGAPTGNAVMTAGSKDDRKFYAVGASPITTSTSRSSRDSNATNYSSSSSFEELRDHHHHSDSLSSGSSSSLSSSTSPSTDLEELIIATTEDPKYAEHAHEYQSRVVVTDQPGPVHIPPGSRTVQAFFQGMPVQARGLPVQQPQAFHHHQQTYYRSGTPARYPGGRAVTPGSRSAKDDRSNPTSRAASRNSQRKIKPTKYKTKPCKFWAIDGTCPSGDECTFRHNEPYPPPVPPLPPNLVLKTSPNMHPAYPVPQEEFRRPSHSPVSPQRIRPEDSGYSQNKKEYFPIAWRVIGGGVRVGNPNYRVGGETFSDCTSSESQFASESAPPSDVEDYLESGPSTAKATSPPEGSQNEEGESGPRVAASAVAAPRTRKRSNSIPPTPSSTQFIVGNLFSAESPGVL